MDYGIPEIYEEEAMDNLKNIYNDIQFILKVPIVNFIFRTLGFYEDFLGIAWNQVRLNMQTIEMEKAAERLRNPEISVDMPKINWNQFYDLRTIEEMKKVLFTFNYVNPKLLLIASAWMESLGNRPIQGSQKPSEFLKPGIIHGLPKIQLVDIKHTAPRVQALLKDIIDRHNAIDAASEYRALAHYPEFLSHSWSNLKSYVNSDEYTILKSKLKAKSIELVHDQMVYPVHLTTELLYHYNSPKEITSIISIVSMFQNLLPELIIEGEFLRRILYYR